MFLLDRPAIVILSFSLPILFSFISWFWLRIWYFQLVAKAKDKIRDRDGKTVPGSPPKMLVGNLPDVYSCSNHLSAYNLFHEKFGEIVQIFWMWRQQISISNYAMARHILIANQNNYEKFPPNSLIQRLFGKSILTITDTGDDWKRHRLLLNEVFSKKNIAGFHDIFVEYSRQLTGRWQKDIERSPGSAEIDIYPCLLAMFLDIIGRAAIGEDFNALTGKTDNFLTSLKYIVYQSTRPVHQFTNWWKHLPLPSNRQLDRAFQTVDNFIERAIIQRKEASERHSFNILDLFLQLELSDSNNREIRDNLLAIIVNGHETVATSVSFSLYLLARHPEKLARARAEVDSIMEQEQGNLTKIGVTKLNYLHSVILETLRFAPAIAGLQRISRAPDILESWSIHSQQVVGITLQPLHHNSAYFGEKAEEFHPERYLDLEPELTSVSMVNTQEYRSQCPLKKLLARDDTPKKNKAGVYFPLTFGDGARRCLGEHFAMYEMKVALAMLLYHFDFQILPNCTAELELGKFGLFLNSFPKHGVKMAVSSRIHYNSTT